MEPDSPAAKAGFKDGDVVLEFNGKKVTDSRHLQLEVADTKPGSTVPVEVLAQWRNKNLERDGQAASRLGARGGK